ncbi:MAG: protease, partial [Bacteroidota bacterium]
MPSFRSSFLTCFLLMATVASAIAQGVEGYYQFPTLHKDQLVFCAEGDLWTVPLSGGLAQRLTTHPEEERYPHISLDGKTLLFSASYEGPTEIYSMPIEGGLPTRWTYESDASIATTWTPGGDMVYATRAYNTKPEYRLVSINPTTKTKTFLPLDLATEASFDASGKTIYFVTPSYHGNVTKRYQGGTARQIWKFTEGTKEAIKLTTDHSGESHHPMWHEGRVYFLTDRDGIMNIWSMEEDGGDLQQHTRHDIFDVRYANVSDGVIVYQKGADLWKYDIAADASSKIPIRLVTDLDQLREKWEENPSRYITSVHPDAKGENIVITARGRVFVAPAKQGRMVSFPQQTDVRFRDAVFSADGKE